MTRRRALFCQLFICLLQTKQIQEIVSDSVCLIDMFESHPDRFWWLETLQTPTVWSPPSPLHPSLKRTSPAWPDWTTTEPAPRYMCLQFTIVLFTIYICIIQDDLLTSPTSCWPHITEAVKHSSCWDSFCEKLLNQADESCRHQIVLNCKITLNYSNA